MEDIVIRKDTDLGFEVYQGCKRSGLLGFDEMLGLIASLTMPDKRPCLQWMKTNEEHERFENFLKRDDHNEI